MSYEAIRAATEAFDNAQNAYLANPSARNREIYREAKTRRATQDQIFRNVAEWHEDRAARPHLSPQERERHERCAFGARESAWEWLQSDYEAREAAHVARLLRLRAAAIRALKEQESTT